MLETDSKIIFSENIAVNRRRNRVLARDLGVLRESYVRSREIFFSVHSTVFAFIYFLLLLLSNLLVSFPKDMEAYFHVQSYLFL